MSSYGKLWRIMALESFVLGIWIDVATKDATAGLLAVFAGVLFWGAATTKPRP